MKYYHLLSSALIGASIVLVQSQVANALSPQQVGEIAQGITVLIEATDKENGSGVIIQKQGNTYTVLTAAHVVESNKKYEIVTPDTQHYQLEYSKVKTLLPNQIDLAVITFTSSNNYQVAKIGNPDKAKLGTTVYVAGFPKQTASRKFSSLSFPPPGQITSNATQAVDGGYTMAYSIPTLRGMSGGPLLNQQGEVIAIHGRGEPVTVEDIVINKVNLKEGYIKGNNNFAISIYTFLRQATSVGVNLGISAPPLQVAQARMDDDSYLKGVDNAQKGNYQGAINDFTQAININPNNAKAYYNRGNARLKLKDNQKAINDFNQAIKINPNYTDAYLSKKDAHTGLNQKTEALLAQKRAYELATEEIKHRDSYYKGFIAALRAAAGDNRGAFGK